ncbi:integrase [Sinirhodobacter populi]|uniref:Integrase n=1 Tax=Paenirhodobacter populi TaxID=2306993 RepID=A0A443KCE5_9RHOB|nr:tyrosine-type recombinase/integrase [Sinirhodobacter populi]RWR30458.1 integrase [Sinirhodobacter populi]
MVKRPRKAALPAVSVSRSSISHGLSASDTAHLTSLFARGTPENTIRAWESDLAYITAWRELRIGAGPEWPETEAVAMAFILDHSRDLAGSSESDPARQVAQQLIDAGLRRNLSCPAASTLDRRIASWRAFHRMRNLQSPFEAPLLRQARQKARKTADRSPSPKSAHPITRDVLKRLFEVSGPGMRGIRDRAILALGWASGGRRRSEIISLDRSDLDLNEFNEKGRIWLRLPGTKTTLRGETPRLVLKGTPARVVVAWIDAAEIKNGPLFRRITRHGTIGSRRLSAGGVADIIRRLLEKAGYPGDYATAHGLRSGFLTQAALDKAPLQAAMKLSLHKSPAQAQRYYADVELTDNPATSLFDLNGPQSK